MPVFCVSSVWVLFNYVISDLRVQILIKKIERVKMMLPARINQNGPFASKTGPIWRPPKNARKT